MFDDDYDGEFRRPSTHRRAAGIEPHRVVCLGSASKSLSPVLRLGWMVLPGDLVGPVLEAGGGDQFYVNGIAQLTMADFVSSGAHDKHIRRMRIRYRRRRDTLVEALQRFDIGITGLNAGRNRCSRCPAAPNPKCCNARGRRALRCKDFR